MKKTFVSFLPPSEFKRLISLMSNVNINVKEEYGMCIHVGNECHILINNDPSLSDQDKQIILWHEKGHALGILDEEDADRYALKHLNTKAQDYLISIWEERHGHPYR